MKHKVRLFILGHPLFVTFHSCVYVFSFPLFSCISQTVWGCNRIQFCREFQLLFLGNKNDFSHRDTIEEILKVLRGPLFLERRLYYNVALAVHWIIAGGLPVSRK